MEPPATAGWGCRQDSSLYWAAVPLDAVVDVPGLCPPPEPYSRRLPGRCAPVAPPAASSLRRAWPRRPRSTASFPHYFKALQARRAISEALRTVFVRNRLDALLTPTLPATAAPKGVDDLHFGPSTEPVVLAYVRTTGPFNLSGLPALSVPAGFDRDGLPIGLQIAAPPFDEETALRVGACFESAAGVSGRQPPTRSAS